MIYLATGSGYISSRVDAAIIEFVVSISNAGETATKAKRWCYLQRKKPRQRKSRFVTFGGPRRHFSLSTFLCLPLPVCLLLETNHFFSPLSAFLYLSALSPYSDLSTSAYVSTCSYAGILHNCQSPHICWLL